MDAPRIILHQGTGQAPACLEGLVEYAREAARHPMAARFGDLDEYVSWSMRQPVLLDRGEGPTSDGCSPAQRSRVWPRSGLNCWEATAHYLAVALRLRERVEIHVYDAPVKGQRHVFPGVRELGDPRTPEPVVLQPPARAQATYARMCAHAQGAGTAFGARKEGGTGTTTGDGSLKFFAERDISKFVQPPPGAAQPPPVDAGPVQTAAVHGDAAYAAWQRQMQEDARYAQTGGGAPGAGIWQWLKTQADQLRRAPVRAQGCCCAPGRTPAVDRYLGMAELREIPPDARADVRAAAEGTACGRILAVDRLRAQGFSDIPALAWLDPTGFSQTRAYIQGDQRARQRAREEQAAAAAHAARQLQEQEERDAFAARRIAGEEERARLAGETYAAWVREQEELARFAGGQLAPEVRAQAWYNDVLGGAHFAGDKALRITDALFLGNSGIGASISDEMAALQGDNTPDRYLTPAQRAAREAERAAKEAEAAAQREAERIRAEAEAQRAELERLRAEAAEERERVRRERRDAEIAREQAAWAAERDRGDAARRRQAAEKYAAWEAQQRENARYAGTNNNGAAPPAA